MERIILLLCLFLLLLISILVLMNSYYINQLVTQKNTMTLLSHKEFSNLKPYVKTFYESFIVKKFIPFFDNQLHSFIEDNALDKFYLANKDKPEFDIFLNRILILLKKYMLANSSATSGNVVVDLMTFLSPENIRYLHQTNISEVNKHLKTEIGKSN